MVKRVTTQPTYSELKEGLLIDEYALDEALANQPDLYFRVGEELENLISFRDEAESDFEDVKAQISIGIRSRARKREEKIAEGEINARVRLDDKYKAAHKKYLDLKNKCGKYSRLEKSFEHRSRALGKLVDLYGAGYFGDVMHRKQTGSMKDHKAADIRGRMNELRKQREA